MVFYHSFVSFARTHFFVSFSRSVFLLLLFFFLFRSYAGEAAIGGCPGSRACGHAGLPTQRHNPTQRPSRLGSNVNRACGMWRAGVPTHPSSTHTHVHMSIHPSHPIPSPSIPSTHPHPSMHPSIHASLLRRPIPHVRHRPRWAARPHLCTCMPVRSPRALDRSSESYSSCGVYAYVLPVGRDLTICMPGPARARATMPWGLLVVFCFV